MSRRLRSRTGKPTRRRILIYVAILNLALITGSEFQAYFWSLDYAQARALRRVMEVCISSGRDPKLLSGPRETKVGSQPWAFEWTYQGQPRYLYGVWFSRSGYPELYGGDPDDPDSAAYEPR